MCAPSDSTTSSSLSQVVQQIELPAASEQGDVSVEAALATRRSVREFSEAPLTLGQVSQLLWAAQGVADPRGRRTAPSAGALYPLEVYLVAGQVEGLAPGIYHYQPAAHRLTLVREGERRPALFRAALEQDAVRDAPVVIALAAVYERTAGKYGARAERYVHMEVGAAAENLLLQAVAVGLGSVYVGAFQDEEVAEVLQLPAEEQPLALLPVGRPAGQ